MEKLFSREKNGSFCRPGVVEAAEIDFFKKEKKKSPQI